MTLRAQWLGWALIAGGVLACGTTRAAAQETVSVNVPSGVGFAVTNIANQTTGSPTPAIVTFSAGTWPPPTGRRLRILVRADAANFTSPSPGGNIPATLVSWTASTSNGQAFNDTLSSAAFRQVYRSPTNTPAGSVSVTWRLAALNAIANLRSGTHTLTVRWRFELQ